jgi:hypothetical protein
MKREDYRCCRIPDGEDLTIRQQHLSIQFASGLHRACTRPLTLDLSEERLDANHNDYKCQCDYRT